MKKNQVSFKARLTVVAINAALMAMVAAPVAHAADAVPDSSAASQVPTVAELTKPTSHIELGIGYVSQDSFKAGEYNALEDQGAYGIANIDLRGGEDYASDSALRWRIKGNNLGLENRNVSAEIGQQGKFRINFGYDELLRNRSDSYMTPFQGVGTNNLTLPATWLKPIVQQNNAANLNYRGLDPTQASGGTIAAGAYTPATAGNIAANALARNADLPLFHNVDLYTKREKYDGALSFSFDNQWEFKASVAHEDKTGYKPMGALNMSGTTNQSSIIPDLIDQTTDQFNASLNFTGDGKFLQAAYYGSIFRNHVASMNWQNPSAGTNTTMSSAPSNQFHQVSMTGGYNFTPSTKLVVNGAYSRNTQNDAFINGSEMLQALPTSSLHGLVVTEAFNMKLTARPVEDLNFAGGYKFENRDNRTPVNTYVFGDAGEAASATVNPFAGQLGLPATLKDNANIYSNRPYSKKSNQINLDADYKLTPKQWIKGGYDFQKIDRQCDGSWYNCADAPTSIENTLRAEWRANFTDDVSGKIGYAYANRHVKYDENAWLALVPMANVIPGSGAGAGATISAYGIMQQLGLGGFGPLAPWVAAQGGNLGIFFPNNSAMPQALYGSRNDIHELPGMRRFNMADRDRNKLRTSVNWQVNDKLSFQGGLDFSKDDYSNSAYGLTDARSWALNLDSNYAVSEDSSFGVFFTHEDQLSKSAGDNYGAGALTNAPANNVSGKTVVSGGCFATVLAKNQNAKVDSCLNWNANMQDEVDTLGFSFKRKNLMAGKVDLGGDLIFSWARTNVDISGGGYANNPLAANAGQVIGAFFIPATNLPTVSTDTIELRLNGKYTINKQSSLKMLYSFMHMSSVDYAYDGMQYGTMATVMPTSEKAPNYNVHAIGLSYEYTF